MAVPRASQNRDRCDHRDTDGHLDMDQHSDEQDVDDSNIDVDNNVSFKLGRRASGQETDHSIFIIVLRQLRR